jgi:hypothetical protein
MSNAFFLRILMQKPQLLQMLQIPTTAAANYRCISDI